MEMSRGTSAAVLVGVWATFALDVFSTLNSSPQTTEIFADDRQDSLMHWVWIGAAVAVAGGLGGTMMSGNLWPLFGSALVAAGMFYAYKHAVARGVGQPPPRDSF